MAKKSGNKSSTSTPPESTNEEALKQRKKLARREAKLMLAIAAAKKNLKRAQKKESKAKARLEEQSAEVHTLEMRLEELQAPSVESANENPPQIVETEEQQVQTESESVIAWRHLAIASSYIPFPRYAQPRHSWASMLLEASSRTFLH